MALVNDAVLIRKALDSLDKICGELSSIQNFDRRDPWMAVDMARVYLADILPEYSDE